MTQRQRIVVLVFTGKPCLQMNYSEGHFLVQVVSVVTKMALMPAHMRQLLYIIFYVVRKG